MKKIFLVALGCLLQLLPTEALAWGGVGHRIVAEVALNFLKPGVADSVQHYLGTMTFKEAATWMDEVRRDSTYDYMKPMHYINVEKNQPYVRTFGPNIL